MDYRTYFMARGRSGARASQPRVTEILHRVSAAACTLAMLSATPVLAQQAFQSNASRDYPNNVSIPTLPTAFMHDPLAARLTDGAGTIAVNAIKHCNKSSFDFEIRTLKGVLQRLSRTADALRQRDAANGAPTGPSLSEFFGGAWDVYVHGQAPDFIVRDNQPNVPLDTQEVINDANTVASIIVLLEQKYKDHCKPPPRSFGHFETRGAHTEFVWDRPLLSEDEYVGVDFGGMGRTSTFDDGTKVKGATPFVGFTGGVFLPFTTASDPLRLAVDGSILLPGNGATHQFATTKLEAVFIGEAGPNFTVPVLPTLPPVTFFARAGFAAGFLGAGSTFPDFNYLNTQVLPGFTVAGGVSIPIGGNMSVLTQLRYLNLKEETFHTPLGGMFKAREEDVMGSTGIQVSFP